MQKPFGRVELLLPRVSVQVSVMSEQEEMAVQDKVAVT